MEKKIIDSSRGRLEEKIQEIKSYLEDSDESKQLKKHGFYKNRLNTKVKQFDNDLKNYKDSENKDEDFIIELEKVKEDAEELLEWIEFELEQNEKEIKDQEERKEKERLEKEQERMEKEKEQERLEREKERELELEKVKLELQLQERKIEMEEKCTLEKMQVEKMKVQAEEKIQEHAAQSRRRRVLDCQNLSRRNLTETY